MFFRIARLMGHGKHAISDCIGRSHLASQQVEIVTAPCKIELRVWRLEQLAEDRGARA